MSIQEKTINKLKKQNKLLNVSILYLEDTDKTETQIYEALKEAYEINEDVLEAIEL